MVKKMIRKNNMVFDKLVKRLFERCKVSNKHDFNPGGNRKDGYIYEFLVRQNPKVFVQFLVW